MAFVIGTNAKDSPSTNVCCIYPAATIDGEFITAKKVFFEQELVKFYKNASKCSDVACQIILPNPPCVPALTQPLKRVLVCTKNRSVYLNGILFAVQGDVTKGLSTDRPIPGPFKYPTIHIANGV